MAPARCQYCRKFFPTPRAVNHHISASKSCSRDWRNDLFRPDNPSPSPSPKHWKKESTAEVEGEEEENLALDHDLGIGDDFVMPLHLRGIQWMKKKMAEVELHTQQVYTSITLNRTQETPGKDSGNQKHNSRLVGKPKRGGKKSMRPVRKRRGMGPNHVVTKNVSQMSTDQFLI
jgi:hypothetical protein